MFNLYSFNFLGLLLVRVLVYANDLYSKFNQHDYNIEFTRAELGEYNMDIFEMINVVTFKYNRSVAVANMTFKTKVFVNNTDSQVIFQVYKFYSNEYRRFPIRLQLNFCNVVKQDLMGFGASFSKCGNYSICNYEKGLIYHLCKWTPDQNKFPPLMPNGEYKVEATIMLVNNSLVSTINYYGRVYRLVN